MKKNQKKKIKVLYTDYEKTAETKKLFNSLANLVKLNYLYEKKLLTKSEYEKVKSAIGFVTDF